MIAHGNEDGLFTVDQRTGAVTVARRLDAVYGRSFRLVLTVKDRGQPENVAVADLTVAVNATSDSPAAAPISRHGLCVLLSGESDVKGVEGKLIWELGNVPFSEFF